MPSKTLVLTSCCKEKLDHAAPARELYIGKLFTLVKQYAEETGSDWRILSAKYGLVHPDIMLEPYDLQISGRAQIDPLQETTLPALAAIWDNYERIIVIMGAQYLKVINPLLKRQGNWKMASNVIVDVVHDERGIGGLMQKVKELIRLAKIPSIRWCHFHPVEQCKYWGCSCSTCEFRPPQTPEFYPTSEEIELRIPRPETRRDYVQGYYTRIQRPDLCSACPHGTDSFNPKRHAALPNGNDNPASTACDYCSIWDDLIPDHLPCSHCGESGHLRRMKNCIFCDNCHQVHQHLEEKPMAEQPKNPETKKDEQYGPLCGKCEKVIPTGTPGMVKDGRTGRWLHQECVDAICGGCHNAIMAGSPNIVKDEHTGESFHAEHFSRDERHQTPPEDQYECIACSKEFPEGEMHRDKDGETWCKKCWAAEHPRKPRAKKGKTLLLEHPAPKRDAPLEERIKAYTETPEYPYEKWPASTVDEIDLWGALSVRNIPRPDDSTKAPAILRAWDQQHKPASKVLRLRGNWIYLDEQHLNELEGEALGKILYAYAIPFDIVGPTKAQMVAAILAAPVGGIMDEQIEGKTIPLQEDLDRALYPDVKAVCDACHQKIYRDQQVIMQGSTSPAIPFHADCHPKREILYHCVFDCAKFRECGVHYIKGCREFAENKSAAEEARQRITAQKRALAGQRLYQIFAMHAAQIAPLLSKEEQVEMNSLQEALNFEY